MISSHYTIHDVIDKCLKYLLYTWEVGKHIIKLYNSIIIIHLKNCRYWKSIQYKKVYTIQERDKLLLPKS